MCEAFCALLSSQDSRLSRLLGDWMNGFLWGWVPSTMVLHLGTGPGLKLGISPAKSSTSGYQAGWDDEHNCGNQFGLQTKGIRARGAFPNVLAYICFWASCISLKGKKALHTWLNKNPHRSNWWAFGGNTVLETRMWHFRVKFWSAVCKSLAGPAPRMSHNPWNCKHLIGCPNMTEISFHLRIQEVI